MILTKGQMIKELKKIGIRKGNKNGTDLKLEHLKFSDIVNLYFTHCIND